MTETKKNRKALYSLLVLVGILAIFYFTMGIFVTQPIGAIPDGSTIVFWRVGTNMPFISSADGLLLDANQPVTLLGRGVLLGSVADLMDGRILIRLPYFGFLYKISTGGQEFDR